MINIRKVEVNARIVANAFTGEVNFLLTMARQVEMSDNNFEIWQK